MARTSGWDLWGPLVTALVAVPLAIAVVVLLWLYRSLNRSPPNLVQTENGTAVRRSSDRHHSVVLKCVATQVQEQVAADHASSEGVTMMKATSSSAPPLNGAPGAIVSTSSSTRSTTNTRSTRHPSTGTTDMTSTSISASKQSGDSTAKMVFSRSKSCGRSGPAYVAPPSYKLPDLSINSNEEPHNSDGHITSST